MQRRVDLPGVENANHSAWVLIWLQPFDGNEVTRLGVLQLVKSLFWYATFGVDELLLARPTISTSIFSCIVPLPLHWFDKINVARRKDTRLCAKLNLTIVKHKGKGIPER